MVEDEVKRFEAFSNPSREAQTRTHIPTPIWQFHDDLSVNHHNLGTMRRFGQTPILPDLPTELLRLIVENACVPSDCASLYILAVQDLKPFELWNRFRVHDSHQLELWAGRCFSLEEVYSALPEDSKERRRRIFSLFVDLTYLNLFQAAYPNCPIVWNEDEGDDSPYLFGKGYDLVRWGKGRGKGSGYSVKYRSSGRRWRSNATLEVSIRGDYPLKMAVVSPVGSHRTTSILALAHCFL